LTESVIKFATMLLVVTLGSLSAKLRPLFIAESSG